MPTPPDPRAAMKISLDRGPDFVPENLFAGSRAAQFRALRAYANTISHGRFAALENSFPKTREAIGEEVFHALAEGYLTGEVLMRPIRLIGKGFPARLEKDDPIAADLADSEWAMLMAHGAADAEALTPDAIKNHTPESLVEIKAVQHPATQIVRLRNASRFSYEYAGDGPLLLITRPQASVLFARIGESEAALLAMASEPIMLGRLLEADGPAVTPLINQGALCAAEEQQ
ncbi:MAG: DUF2063 domain-containing protein [Sphingomonas sp.]|nr:DUF2063 domain-containing protein [Sphingomonas sp.]